MSVDTQAWRDRWLTAVKTLSGLGEILRGPPPGDASSERLTALLDVFSALNVPVNQQLPAQECARTWVNKVASNHAREDINDAIGQAVLDLEQAVAICLKSGVANDQVIAVADFGNGGGIRLQPSGWRVPGRSSLEGSEIYLACGLIAALPPGHRLRSILDHDQYFQHGRQDAAIVLGPTLSNNAVRSWYVLGEALRLTQQFRHEQVRKIAEEAEEERLRQLHERQAWHASELGELRRRMQYIAKLEAEGKITDLPPAPPAVRVGGR